MCGISGFAHRDPGRPINKQMLSAMTDIIRHRGPGPAGFYLFAFTLCFSILQS
jgi:asparagine synthetase B (glutamine-hydrolysing)